jgi:hypothetical protein
MIRKTSRSNARRFFFREEKTMFIMSMPESFRVGDTAACRINGEISQLTWRSPNTLVIGATDARNILKHHVEDGVRSFICDDGDGTPYGVDEILGEGFIVFSEPKGNAS